MTYWIAEDNSTLDFTPHNTDGWRKATKKEYEAARKAKAIERLLKMLRPGDSVYPVCTHRGAGMTARFRVFLPVKAGRRLVIQDVTNNVALAAGLDVRGWEIVMGGGGYSKSFEIVYALGSALWPKGTRKPHGTRNGQPDRAGGYALQDGRL